MYKYYKKSNYMVMMYEFDSIHEFLTYLDETPSNDKAWGYRTFYSMSPCYSFSKTNSLEEAMKLCKYGYHEDFEKLVNLNHVLERYVKIKNSRIRQYNYYVGFAPDVKAYLEGSPLSMFNIDNPKRKQIDIYYNSAILGMVSSEMIFNRGAVTLSLIRILESMGFSIGLNVFTMSKECRQIHYAKFNLKRNDERMNIQKLYFPLCHPSFLRRLVFRLREVTPDISAYWSDGYGETCDESIIRNVIDLNDDDIVICQPEEMGVYGYDIIEDATNMLTYINQYTSDEINLDYIKSK